LAGVIRLNNAALKHVGPPIFRGPGRGGHCGAHAKKNHPEGWFFTRTRVQFRRWPGKPGHPDKHGQAMPAD